MNSTVVVAYDDTITFTITMTDDTWNDMATAEDIETLATFSRGSRRARLMNLAHMLRVMEGDDD